MRQPKKRKTKMGGSTSPHRSEGDDDAAAVNKRSPFPSWTSGAYFLVATAVVTLVFVPWLSRYIDGQFFGTSGDYGTDFFRYALGSAALIEQGIDPYSNEQMHQALEAGKLGTDHPNPYYDERTTIKAFAETPEPIAKGVVSPPFLLVMIYPLLRLCAYTLAVNVWTVASLLGIAWLCVQFWKRLMSRELARWKQIASHSAMLSLLVLSSFPVLWSAIYGQFEVIYFLAMGGAIYLWSFQPDRAATPLVVGLLLAIGGAVKLFPLLLLGYFCWHVLQTYRLPVGDPPSIRTLIALPETRVVVYGSVFFVALCLITGFLLGFDVYGSFVRKIVDLQAEGSGPSMKGNLLSYLNFVPVWLTNPFAPMHRGVWFIYAVIAAGVVVVLARSICRSTGSPDSPEDGRLQRMLDMTLIIAALPTILPHWWIYYNVILILPLMACFVAGRATVVPWRRRAILTLLGLSFALTFSYLTTTVFFGAFPDIYAVLMNRPAIDVALAQATADPKLLENLPYSSAFGEPYVTEFEGRVVSLFNLLFGYPGTVFLLLANWLAIRSKRRPAVDTIEPSGNVEKKWRRPSRVTIPLAITGGLLVSWAGGAAIVWEGYRRIALVPHIEVVTDDPTIDNPEEVIDQMLARCRRTARREGNSAVFGLVAELPPPSHFIAEIAQTDTALATAILRQDRRYFEDPHVTETLLDMFIEYQTKLDEQYAVWSVRGDARELPVWRGQSDQDVMLKILERRCREQFISLRRVDQDWQLWQTKFLYEFAWQGAVESFTNGDFVGFVKFIVEHLDSLGRHQALLESIDARVRVAATPSANSSGHHPSFVYFQAAPYTSLSYHSACRGWDENSSLESCVLIGTRYLVEELIRRARLAKNGNPREALAFAEHVVSQISETQIDAWWSEQVPAVPARIFDRLSRDGMLDPTQVDLDGPLTWDLKLVPQ